MGLLPLTSDFEEARACHVLFLKQLVAQNPALMKEPAAAKAALGRMTTIEETRSKSAVADKEEDILGDEGRALLQQVLALLQ